jgi:hypothetical protein
MIEIVSKSGKRLAKIADSLDDEDQIYLQGKAVPLSDAYNSQELRDKFNDSVKEMNDVPQSKDSTEPED